MEVNLDQYSFDEWITFLFDHPASKGEWQRAVSISWMGNPNKLIRYTIDLFENADVVLRVYSREQIEQGFWWLLGPEGGLRTWIWDQNIPWQLRKECINSMAKIFENLFSGDPHGDICHMWWDLLRSFDDPVDERTESVIFNTLSRILQLDSNHCQLSALHGLGHLKHPEKKHVISDYLEKHPELDEKSKSYALAAIEGKVQ